MKVKTLGCSWIDCDVAVAPVFSVADFRSADSGLTRDATKCLGFLPSHDDAPRALRT